MMFWDSSALVTLILEQPRSAHARSLAKEDTEMIVWWASSVECASAIARMHREGRLNAAGERSARRLLAELSASWFEIQAATSLRDQAMRLLRLHPLGAADALQLAAAIEWSGTSASGNFVTYDDRLREAAEREGFTTL